MLQSGKQQKVELEMFEMQFLLNSINCLVKDGNFSFYLSQKNVLLTCIKIQGFPMKINHLQKWLCLCFLYWFHQLRMAVKAKTLSNFFSVAPLLILDFLSLGRETEIIKILKKKGQRKSLKCSRFHLRTFCEVHFPLPSHSFVMRSGPSIHNWTKMCVKFLGHLLKQPFAL